MAHSARTHLDLTLPDAVPTAVLAAVVGIDRVVRLNRKDLAVFYMALEDACGVPATVGGA